MQDCDLKVYAGVVVDEEAARGIYLCGVTSVDFEGGGDALACGFQSGMRFSSRLVDSRHYDEDDIPVTGSDKVVIEAEACAYAFRVNATEYCETFHHVAYVPGHACACGGVSKPVMDEADYWMAEAKHAPPPSVYP